MTQASVGRQPGVSPMVLLPKIDFHRSFRTTVATVNFPGISAQVNGQRRFSRPEFAVE
jgi:hypothetical protein